MREKSMRQKNFLGGLINILVGGEYKVEKYIKLM